MHEGRIVSRDKGAGALADELQACHRQTARLAVEAFPRETFEALQDYQRRRLAMTYADLAARERYRAAVAFFLDELYGGRDLRRRDRQVEAALPIMERSLPRGMRRALADAFQLQALSLELDIALTETLAERGVKTVDTAAYVAVYPIVARARRETQIRLIHALALELDRVVHLPLVLGLIRAMRRPARAMGFGALQSFLERGLGSFRAMQGAERFAATIRDRETVIMERLYAGDASPFRGFPPGASA